MKKILILGISCLLLFFASSAFALEKGRVIATFDNDSNQKATVEKAIDDFHFYNSLDFVAVFKQTRGNWESQGYKCSIIDINADRDALVVIMHCNK